MTKLYFGDATAAAATLMILALVVFIGYTIVNRDRLKSSVFGLWRQALP